jgi:hypothetical protein
MGYGAGRTVNCSKHRRRRSACWPIAPCGWSHTLRPIRSSHMSKDLPERVMACNLAFRYPIIRASTPTGEPAPMRRLHLYRRSGRRQCPAMTDASIVSPACPLLRNPCRSAIFPWSSVASARWRALVRPHQHGIDSESVGFLAYPGLPEPALAIKVRYHADMLSMITEGT